MDGQEQPVSWIECKTDGERTAKHENRQISSFGRSQLDDQFKRCSSY